MTNLDTHDSKSLEAAQFILEYAMQSDNTFHKQWVIDQVLRILLDETYDQTIEEYNANADKYSQWDIGC